jgi:hydroxymethylpyrimidine/phosphomethylpyrimidine kinase
MPRVLAIAGSDSGGGAGIQADLKTVMAMGGYCQTAITALTAQDTRGVAEIFRLPTAFIRRQIDMAFNDIGVDAIKTGMLHDRDVIETVADAVSRRPDVALVVDPVMAAKGGTSLLDPVSIATLISRLAPLATLLTPNVPEAAALTGITITGEADMARAADLLMARGVGAVLIKGGHLQGTQVTDLLVWSGGVQRFSASRIETRHDHGTGCTLASAVATGLASGVPLDQAVAAGRDFVRRTLLATPGLGQGHGPLGHGAAMCEPHL